MQSPKIGMIKLHLSFSKRVFTARATIMYLCIYMYLIIFSSFANSSTDITHLNQHARPGVTAYVGIDNKRMKYVNVPEHRLPRGEDNKIKDIEYTQNLSSSLGLENLHLTHCFRLGKKTQTSSRPLKLVLEIRSQRKFLLDNAKFVPEKAPIHLRQAIIVKDMTQSKEKRDGQEEEIEIELKM